MRHYLKLVLIILALLAVLFGLSKVFDLTPFNKEVCPPSKCTFSKDGQVVSIQEKGRVRQDYTPNPPPGLPADLPVDSQPLRVLGSYQEAMIGDQKEGEEIHTQITYIYTSQKQASRIMADFEAFFKEKGFSLTVSDNKLSLGGEKFSKLTTELVSLSVATQNQFERLVTFSLIISQKALTK